MTESYTGMTPQRKEDIKQEQKGICAICFKETELVIDHDHSTDHVREGLCRACNAGLGFFQDDWDNLLRAACYVLVHKAHLTDLRIGYKLLFEEARKQEARQMSNAKREAKKQLCQQIQELTSEKLASVEETIRTVGSAGQGTSTSKDSVP